MRPGLYEHSIFLREHRVQKSPPEHRALAKRQAWHDFDTRCRAVPACVNVASRLAFLRALAANPEFWPG
jgi:hypothetical protein